MPLIHFNKDVRKIIYNQSKNEPLYGRIKIECEDSSTYSADHVICTVSLGVLKERHLKMFEPPLSLTKYIAIEALDYGTVDKIYLEFEKQFWSADWRGFTILWKLEHLKELREDPINGEWLEGLSGFFIFNTYQPNTLCAWIAGPMALKMEQVDDANVKTGTEKVLRMCLKQWNIPNAKSMIR